MNREELKEAIKWAEGRGILYVFLKRQEGNAQYCIQADDTMGEYLSDEDAVRALIGESHGTGKEAEMARTLLAAVAMQVDPDALDPKAPFQEGDRYWTLRQVAPKEWSLVESVWDDESMRTLKAATNMGELYPSAYAALDTLKRHSFIRIEPIELARIINIIKN